MAVRSSQKVTFEQYLISPRSACRSYIHSSTSIASQSFALTSPEPPFASNPGLTGSATADPNPGLTGSATADPNGVPLDNKIQGTPSYLLKISMANVKSNLIQQ